MTVLRRPTLNPRMLAPHILNCAPRSALERESIRHPSPWCERWAFMLIGMILPVVFGLAVLWVTRP